MQSNIHVGRLTKEFELKHVGKEHNLPMVRFCLAVKRSSSKNAVTDFIYYMAFGKTAELLNEYYNHKGVALEVRFTQQSSNVKQENGTTYPRVTNVVNEFYNWGSGNKKTSSFDEIDVDEMADAYGQAMQTDDDILNRQYDAGQII